MGLKKERGMSCLKIVGLNMDILWKDKEENFKQIEKAFANEEADLFLLPEMFSTGFCMDAEEIADQNNETLEWMLSFAKHKKSSIAGSVSVKEKNSFYNRFYFVHPDGNVDEYNKRHLFSYSGEDKIYESGEERVIVNFKGFRILLQVCYDLRFPVFARNRMDYDAILYVANWPKVRVDAWETLLKARAIENQSFVFGLNRIGVDGNDLEYQESSHCYFPDGRIISEKSGNYVKAVLDMEELKAFRKRFRFLNDGDDFTISN